MMKWLIRIGLAIVLVAAVGYRMGTYRTDRTVSGEYTFDDKITLNGEVYIANDTLLLTDGGADTAKICMDGTYLYILSDNVIRLDGSALGIYCMDRFAGYGTISELGDSIVWTDGSTDSTRMVQNGTNFAITTDNGITVDDNITIGGKDSLVLTDGGADSVRIYDSGSYTTIEADNPIDLKTGTVTAVRLKIADCTWYQVITFNAKVTFGNAATDTVYFTGPAVLNFGIDDAVTSTSIDSFKVSNDSLLFFVGGTAYGAKAP